GGRGDRRRPRPGGHAAARDRGADPGLRGVDRRAGEHALGPARRPAAPGGGGRRGRPDADSQPAGRDRGRGPRRSAPASTPRPAQRAPARRAEREDRDRQGGPAPHLSLVGSINLDSEKAENFFEGRSFEAFGGPTFSWAILNYGRISNNVRVQDAEYQA